MTAELKQKVQVWIFSRTPRGGYLLLLLKTIPERGSFWQPVTGSVERGESLEQAAQREAIEETGLKLGPAPISLDFEFTFQSRWGTACEHAFSLEVQLDSAQTPVTIDPIEHVDYQWTSPEEAMRLLKFESNRLALTKLLAKS